MSAPLVTVGAMAAPPDQPQTGPSRTERARVRAHRWRVVRWSVLAALVLGLVVAWILGPPEQCKEAATDTRVVEVCEPISVTSPIVWVVLLGAGLLLVPDFAEVQLGGVLGLRREIAETQERVAGVQRDLAQMSLAMARAAAGAASSAAAQAEAFAEVEQHLHLHMERQAATAAAVEAAHTERPVIPGRRSPGIYASAAMHAGMLGLGGLFPPWCGPVQVVGLTPDDGELEITHDYYGVRAAYLDRVRALLAEPSGEVSVDLDEEAWVATCAALDDDGRAVGAVGVVLHELEPPADGQDLSAERLEELAAAVETAARTYARLLVDLLGERASGPSVLPPAEPPGPTVVTPAKPPPEGAQ